MKLYLLTYNNGEEYEMNRTEQVGIFDSFEKARDIALINGFESMDNDLFRRDDRIELDEYISQVDYMYIDELELNVLKTDF